MGDIYQDLLEQFKDAGLYEAFKEGERNVILRLMYNHSIEEISESLDMEVSDIVDYLNRVYLK